MSLRPASATLALTAAFGCTINVNPGTTETDSNTAADSTGGAGTTGTDTGEKTTTGEPTTGTTNVGPTTTTPTSSGTTGEPAPVWCNGLDPAGPATLTVHNGDDMKISDGSPLPAQCGGQGSLMLPIFPHFGGFTPEMDNVGFDIILDVEGFNLGPDGHFFQALDHQHDVNCAYTEPYYDGFSYAFIPIFPPDAIPDIKAVDGKPGVLHVTLHSPIGDMTLDAKVVLTVPLGVDDCGYGGYTDTDGGTGGGGSSSTGP